MNAVNAVDAAPAPQNEVVAFNTPAHAVSSAREHVVSAHPLLRAAEACALIGVLLCSLVLLVVAPFQPDDAADKAGPIVALLLTGTMAVGALRSVSRTTWLRISGTTIEVWTRWPGCARTLEASIPRSSCARVISDSGIMLCTENNGNIHVRGQVNGEYIAKLLDVPFVIVPGDSS